MLSRVAESIFWIGRYTERAENTARLINLNMNLQLDMPRHARPGWNNMIKIAGSESLFRERYKNDDERSVVKYMLIDSHNPGSMLNAMAWARENARTVRDILPQSAWEQLNVMYATARDNADKGITRKNRFEYLNTVIRDSQTLNGLLQGTMLHDAGYSVLRMGRSLERADMTTRIIDVLSSETVDGDPAEEGNNALRWMGLLKTLSAYQMYRREMEVAVDRAPVLAFLFKCPTFPRSIMHCVNIIEECLGHMPRFNLPLQETRALAKLLNRSEPGEMTQIQLHDYIDELQLALVQINDAISKVYFQPGEISATA